MSLSIIHTRAQLGVDAPLVTVETHLSNGLPALSIVGLPEMAVRESKDRVRSALINSGFEFPTRRITINLAPADLPKQGGRYDLAIAMGILVASGQLPAENTLDCEFIGELALTGEIRPVFGVLPAAIACVKQQRTMFVAKDNAAEAALSDSENLYAAKHLNEVCQHLSRTAMLAAIDYESPHITTEYSPDLKDVKGQFQARRALEIAAAGHHNLLFYGPPGTGKSMLASRLPSILPALNRQEAVEVASIYSLAGHYRPQSQVFTAPFRAPHHTASSVALVGGGSFPRPGEISLSHHGVLFLDELPEFGRKVLEVLREPIESGEIRIARAHSTIIFPAKFQLLAAMNPCPCGFAGHPRIACTDTPQQISQYRKKLSGPLLDRFDLHVEVAYQAGSVLLDRSNYSESSETVFQRVKSAHDRQWHRQSKLNSELSPAELQSICPLTAHTQQILERAMDRLALSARGAHRIIRVARTLADLEGADTITEAHLGEALAYRGLDRQVSSI
jgi:magnesium chelatase family protein